MSRLVNVKAALEALADGQQGLRLRSIKDAIRRIDELERLLWDIATAASISDADRLNRAIKRIDKMLSDA